MLQRLLLGVTAVFVLALTGCALSPQQLNPEPRLNGNLTAVGQGQPVVVKVVDGRSSPVLGTRGGLYADTSNIVVPAENVLPKLQAQTEAAVRLLGFTPNPNAGNAPQLTVVLADMKYQSPKDQSYVTKADISATLRAEMRSPSGRQYTGRYAASMSQSFGMAPNVETNTKLVSDVLSDALTRLFRDPTIGEMLQSR